MKLGNDDLLSYVVGRSFIVTEIVHGEKVKGNAIYGFERGGEWSIFDVDSNEYNIVSSYMIEEDKLCTTEGRGWDCGLVFTCEEHFGKFLLYELTDFFGVEMTLRP